MKIAIALLLTILFGISAILYRATETSDLGFLGMMVIQIICFVGIWAREKNSLIWYLLQQIMFKVVQGLRCKVIRRNLDKQRLLLVMAKICWINRSNKGRIRNQPLTQRMVRFAVEAN